MAHLSLIVPLSDTDGNWHDRKNSIKSNKIKNFWLIDATDFCEKQARKKSA